MIIDIPFILLITLIILQLLDVYTTKTALSLKNTVEANPVVKFLIDKLGLTFGLLSIKFLLVAVLIIAFPYTHLYALIGLNLLYVGIVINNFLVIRKNGNLYKK